MAGQKEKDLRFDQKVLQSMHEPLTVRVEKIKGNVKQPIELPLKDNAAPGTNWTRDEVLSLENWLLTKWSGGGYYRASVTDAKGAEMVWEFVYDPRLYPERVPPNTMEAAYVNSPNAAGVSMSNQPPTVPSVVQPLGAGGATGWPPSTVAMGYGNPPQSAGPVIAQMQQPAPQQVIMQMPAPQQMPQGPWAQPQQPPPSSWVQPQQPPPSSWVQMPNGQWMQQGPAQPWGPQAGPGYGPQPQWPGYPQPSYPQPSTGYPSRYGFDPYDDWFARRRDRGPRDRDDHDERARRETEEREKLRREHEEKQRALEAQIRQQELDRKELEYKAALDRIQQQQSQQITQLQQQAADQIRTLQEEMRRLAENKTKPEDEEVRRLREEQVRLQAQITEQQLAAMRQAFEQQVLMLREELGRMNEKPTGENDEMRRLREEQERQRQEMERQRQEMERERDRLAQERRDEMTRQEIKEQRQAFEAQLQALTQSQANRSSDPVIEALKDSARTQAETMREVSRMQQQQTDRMTAFMVAPAQLAQIMKDNSSSSDSLMKNVVDSVGGIVNMYKTAAEQIMQMSGGGGEPPAVRLIQEGIGRASEIAERYLSVKRDQVISESKVKQAEAQRDTVKASADAQARAAAQMRAQQMAQAQAQAAAQRQAQAQQAAAGNGLGGTQPARPQAAPAPQARPQPRPRPRPQPQQPQPQPHDNGANGSIPVVEVVTASEPELQGKVVGRITPAQRPTTEEEMFGIALESVKRLRKGVSDGKLEPSQAVDAILQGVEYVITNNLTIPAFVLFQQERWADFIDVLLPEAMQSFKDECVRILNEEVEVVDESETEDAASGDDADGADTSS